MATNNSSRNKYPKLRHNLKFVFIFSLVIGIAWILLAIKCFFHLPHYGDKFDQGGVDSLIRVARVVVLVFFPAVSILSFFISYAMWLSLKELDSDLD
jgi:hypothetical protein